MATRKDESRDAVLGFIKENPGKTVRDISRGTGLSESTVRKALTQLLAEVAVAKRKKALRQNVSAQVYTAVGEEPAPEPQAMPPRLQAGNLSVRPLAIQFRFSLEDDGSGDFEPNVLVEYAPGMDKLKVLSWVMIVVSADPIPPLERGCQVTHYSQEYKMWITGPVSAPIGARVQNDNGDYVYVCRGIGQPEIRCQG